MTVFERMRSQNAPLIWKQHTERKRVKEIEKKIENFTVEQNVGEFYFLIFYP